MCCFSMDTILFLRSTVHFYSYTLNNCCTGRDELPAQGTTEIAARRL